MAKSRFRWSKRKKAIVPNRPKSRKRSTRVVRQIDVLKPPTQEELDRIYEEIAIEERERERVQAEEAAAEFLKKAKQAGFTESQLRFLEENFASIDHEHWDGKIGG